MTGPTAAELFEKAPCGLVATTLSGSVTAVNETFLSMTGRSSAEVVGRYLMSLLTRGSALFYETRFMPMLRAQNRVNEIALEVRLPASESDGTAATRPHSTLSVFVNAVIDTSGSEPVVRYAVFDATVRRHYERELLEARRAAETSERRVRILQLATTNFGAAQSEEQLGRALLEAAADATDASHVAVYFFDELGDLLLAAGPPNATPILSANRDTPSAQAVRTTRTVMLGDSTAIGARFPQAAEPLRRMRVEAITAVPIVDTGVSRGVLMCGFGRRRDLDEPTIDLLESLADQVVTVRQRILLQQQIRFQALHDALTGLPNRLSLQHRLDEVLSVGAESPPLALLFIDLDGFKAINDRVGHQVGDEVLCEVSERLSTAVRKTDTVARLGGDEFLIVCENLERNAVIEIADRIRAAIREPLSGVAAGLSLSASIGISFRSPDDRQTVDAETLIRLADEAMYESKRAGKDRCTLVEA